MLSFPLHHAGITQFQKYLWSSDRSSPFGQQATALNAGHSRKHLRVGQALETQTSLQIASQHSCQQKGMFYSRGN